MHLFERAEWRVCKEIKKLRLKNKTPTVISSNCNGGMILHDLGLKFNTPTINLFFSASDYLKLIGNMRYYFSIDPVKIEYDKPYPVGKIDDIVIHFMHYNSFEEASEKWCERRNRIDYDNLFFMFSDKNGCTYEDIKSFDNLHFEHKVIFTHKQYPEFKSAYYIKGFENDGEVGILSDFMPGKLRRRYLDAFDYVSFLNGKSVEEINRKRRDI